MCTVSYLWVDFQVGLGMLSTYRTMEKHMIPNLWSLGINFLSSRPQLHVQYNRSGGHTGQDMPTTFLLLDGVMGMYRAVFSFLNIPVSYSLRYLYRASIRAEALGPVGLTYVYLCTVQSEIQSLPLCAITIPYNASVSICLPRAEGPFVRGGVNSRGKRREEEEGAKRDCYKEKAQVSG
ncbi:hypothetical protein C7212DRAFT_340363 [Tuber magnatum]|uniref:Uncharacterized protein n=1 Tax=Tuber magnatum TaxID=42249 RepID=A0A317SWF8_9PEZI|nr:hypothetical protein C7212DRAFT_340363 [Tuber magnatum]